MRIFSWPMEHPDSFGRSGIKISSARGQEPLSICKQPTNRAHQNFRIGTERYHSIFSAILAQLFRIEVFSDVTGLIAIVLEPWIWHSCLYNMGSKRTQPDSFCFQVLLILKMISKILSLHSSLQDFEESSEPMVTPRCKTVVSSTLFATSAVLDGHHQAMPRQWPHQMARRTSNVLFIVCLVAL